MERFFKSFLPRISVFVSTHGGTRQMWTSDWCNPVNNEMGKAVAGGRLPEAHSGTVGLVKSQQLTS